MPETTDSSTYSVERKETAAGTFVEVYDAAHSEDEPAAFLPEADAVEMAETILKACGDSA